MEGSLFFLWFSAFAAKLLELLTGGRERGFVSDTL